MYKIIRIFIVLIPEPVCKVRVQIIDGPEEPIQSILNVKHELSVIDTRCTERLLWTDFNTAITKIISSFLKKRACTFLILIYIVCPRSLVGFNIA